MRPFEYYEPATMREAMLPLATYGKQAQILAGGIDLIPKLRSGIIQAEHIVSIRKIAGLDRIEPMPDGGIAFGAMVKLRDLETSRTVQSIYPILYEAIHQLTSVQTKFMGTAVGNLCVATPASDIATALIALGARLKILGIGGERMEPLEDFYLGYHMTSLGKGEIATEVVLPRPQPGTGTGFVNLLRTRADIAKLIVAASIVTEDGVCHDVRIAVGSAAPTVFRAKTAEALLEGRKIDAGLIAKAADLAAEAVRPITDIRSTAGYRKEMTRVLARRALAKAIERAGPQARNAQA